MISISYIYIAAILLLIWAIYRVTLLIKIKEKNLCREVVINIFFIYFLILISLTVCKMSTLYISLEHKFYINYIPFVETINMFKDNFIGVGFALYNVVGNILLFVPIGFFIPLLFKNKNKISSIALYGFCISLSIELIQFFTATNFTDIDDVIFNTLGAVLGLGIYNIFYYIIKKTKLIKYVTNVTSEFNGNLGSLIIKPVSCMLFSVLICIIMIIYNSTIATNVSNDDIAKVVFKNNMNTNFEAVKDISEYKLFLKKEDSYINLLSIETILNNRWSSDTTYVEQYEESNGDYGVATIYEDTNEENPLICIAVFGKNKNASKVEIIFNGESYVEKIKSNEYFIVTLPRFQTIPEQNDIDNIYNGKDSKILKVRFLESDGNAYNKMRFAR